MNTWVLIVGIILLIIGIIMIMVGISIHENNIANGTTIQPWYVWFLIICGIVISIIGGLVMAFAASGKKKAACPPPPCGPPPCPQQYVQVAHPQQQYTTVTTTAPAVAPQPKTYNTFQTSGLPAVYPSGAYATEYAS